MTAARARAGALAIALAAAAVLAGCEAPQYEQRWDRLHVGMSKAQVEALLGKPSSVHRPKASAQAGASGAGDAAAAPGAAGAPEATATSGTRGERWQYGDTLSSFATGAVFPDEADERAWCVFFGQDGRVTGFRAAGWTGGSRPSHDPDPAR
ncbi:MAG: hypothetical protein U0625_05750 [Phycisphaerales bacterium]